jgi:hypothetical protein
MNLLTVPTLIVSAQVELTQVYANADALQNTGARYLFPIPANAAVCAFRMETADGRVVHAFVKEKEAAKQEYESAVKKGKWAGLLEQVTGDGELRVGYASFGANAGSPFSQYSWSPLALSLADKTSQSRST